MNFRYYLTFICIFLSLFCFIGDLILGDNPLPYLSALFAWICVANLEYRHEWGNKNR